MKTVALVVLSVSAMVFAGCAAQTESPESTDTAGAAVVTSPASAGPIQGMPLYLTADHSREAEYVCNLRTKLDLNFIYFAAPSSSESVAWPMGADAKVTLSAAYFGGFGAACPQSIQDQRSYGVQRHNVGCGSYTYEGTNATGDFIRVNDHRGQFVDPSKGCFTKSVNSVIVEEVRNGWDTFRYNLQNLAVPVAAPALAESEAK